MEKKQLTEEEKKKKEKKDKLKQKQKLLQEKQRYFDFYSDVKNFARDNGEW